MLWEWEVDECARVKGMMNLFTLVAPIWLRNIRNGFSRVKNSFQTRFVGKLAAKRSAEMLIMPTNILSHKKSWRIAVSNLARRSCVQHAVEAVASMMLRANRIRELPSSYIWSPPKFRILWPSPPCLHKELIYSIEFTQASLLQLLFWDPSPLKCERHIRNPLEPRDGGSRAMSGDTAQSQSDDQKTLHRLAVCSPLFSLSQLGGWKLGSTDKIDREGIVCFWEIQWTLGAMTSFITIYVNCLRGHT